MDYKLGVQLVGGFVYACVEIMRKRQEKIGKLKMEELKKRFKRKKTIKDLGTKFELLFPAVVHSSQKVNIYLGEICKWHYEGST